MITSRPVAMISLVGALALSVWGPPAHAGSLSKPRNNNAQAQAQTQEFVDARMHETLSSIDRSLTTLVQVSRGGEPPRKPGIIGETVAGAAGPARPVVKPEGAPVSNIPMDASVLSRRVQIQWNGSAQELLRNMSQQLGFTFSSPSNINHKVRLEGENLTVEQTLNQIARQLDGKADIVVSLANRKITLVKK